MWDTAHYPKSQWFVVHYVSEKMDVWTGNLYNDKYTIAMLNLHRTHFYESKT